MADLVHEEPADSVVLNRKIFWYRASRFCCTEPADSGVPGGDALCELLLRRLGPCQLNAPFRLRNDRPGLLPYAADTAPLVLVYAADTTDLVLAYCMGLRVFFVWGYAVCCGSDVLQFFDTPHTPRHSNALFLCSTTSLRAVQDVCTDVMYARTGDGGGAWYEEP